MRRTQAPILPVQRGADRDAEQVAPSPVERPEADDARLQALATIAVEAIAARVAQGADTAAALADVVESVFGDPATGDDTERDRWLVADRAAVERIVAALLDVLGGPGG